MINIYPIVFTTLDTALTNKATVAGPEQVVIETFPYVTVEENSNITYRSSQDGSLIEHHASLLYVINVYSNVSHTEAEEIIDIVDIAMQNMKFTRMRCQPTPNIDRTLYRYTATYEAVVAEPVTSGNDTVYQMYRR